MIWPKGIMDGWKIKEFCPFHSLSYCHRLSLFYLLILATLPLPPPVLLSGIFPLYFSHSLGRWTEALVFDWQLLRIAAPGQEALGSRRWECWVAVWFVWLPASVLQDAWGRGVSQHAAIWYCWQLNNERHCDSILFLYKTPACPQRHVTLHVIEKKK